MTLESAILMKDRVVPDARMKTLSKRQLSILLFFLTYEQVYQTPPLVMEIVRAHRDLPYTTVQRDLDILIRTGWLRRIPGKFRAVRINF